jgi:N-acyl-D-aspartate/D-glutamate deacylase
MRALVQEAMEAGAIGVSTGLFYEPAIAAPTEEVIETCRPLKDFGGVYCTHMRDEGDGIIDSLEETFRIGREVGVPVVISHHKLIGQANYGRSPRRWNSSAATWRCSRSAWTATRTRPAPPCCRPTAPPAPRA